MYNLSIIDFRQKPTHLFMGDDLPLLVMIEKINSFFVGWETAFCEQSHKNKTILELHDLEFLGYQSFYLQSIGEENAVHKVVLSPKNDFKIGDFRVVITKIKTA
jgi:hypothetical protein